MSVINPNESQRTWQAQRREPAVPLYLADSAGDAAALVGSRIADFSLSVSVAPPGEAIEPEAIAAVPAAVVQVDAGRPESIARFKKLAAASATPVIAAAYEPSLAFVRELILAGAHDVLPLPLDVAELERSLAPIRQRINAGAFQPTVRPGKIVTMLKAVGGVGATSLLTQTAIRYARQQAAAGGEAGLLDLDVQFGDAAFQLGLRPSLSVADLVAAGGRLDADMIRAAAVPHASGLKVIGAPRDMLPLDAVDVDHAMEIADIAASEFGTLFIDLPSNWTNWSLSLVARSDLVLLITEMNVSCLHRARRQLDLLRSQDLGDLEVRVIVNRFEKGLLKTVRLSDVEKSLGRPAAYAIANDHALMRGAIDRGVPIDEIQRKSALARDVDQLAAGIAAAIGTER